MAPKGQSRSRDEAVVFAAPGLAALVSSSLVVLAPPWFAILGLGTAFSIACGLAFALTRRRHGLRVSLARGLGAVGFASLAQPVVHVLTWLAWTALRLPELEEQMMGVMSAAGAWSVAQALRIVTSRWEGPLSLLMCGWGFAWTFVVAAIVRYGISSPATRWLFKPDEVLFAVGSLALWQVPMAILAALWILRSEESIAEARC